MQTTIQQAELSDLLDQRQALSETIKSIDEEKKSLDEQIKATLGAMGVQKAQTAKWAVQIIKSSRKQLSEKLLLENGVKAEVIAASKKETEVVSLRVDAVKGKE